MTSFSGCQIESFYVKVRTGFHETTLPITAEIFQIMQLTLLTLWQSRISPDASHLLSGSSDGSGYIWQVHLQQKLALMFQFTYSNNRVSWQMNKPDAAPITLNSHDGEVSAVAWYVSLESYSAGNQILYFTHKLLIFFLFVNLPWQVATRSRKVSNLFWWLHSKQKLQKSRILV